MNEETDPAIKERINTNILDSLDTLRTSSMLFRILSTSKDDLFCYSNEIFGISSYFCNKLLKLRSESMQKKFLSFFKTDPTSQNFFRQCNEYLKVHQEKLKKNILRPFYSRQMYTNELAETCYVVDMNLEKQVVTLLKNFCLQGNTEMQDYLRDQTFSAKSYNMVETVTDYAAEFLTHLQYPVAFDTFRRTLAALNDFIQGPNMAKPRNCDPA